MAELLVVGNPKRRRKARKRRMPAGLARYWAKRRGRGHRRRSASKVHHRRRPRAGRGFRRRRRSVGGRRRAVMGYVVGKRRIRRYKLNPHRRRFRRRRNPSLSVRGITGQVMPTIKSGAWGAGGALGLDVLWGLVNNRVPALAAYLTNPYVGYAAKAVGAVTVGALGGKLFRGRGTAMAVGAMTVVTHDFLKSLLQGMAPGMFGPGGTFPLGAYLSGPGVGAYLSGSAPMVGTATYPQAYLPFGSLRGGSGITDGAGVYTDDMMGSDVWGSELGS